MSEKEIERLKKEYEYGTTEYFKINLREMINSVWCYDCYKRDYSKYLRDRYITDYYTKTDYYNGKARLTKEQVEEIVKEQVDYLEDNCYIKWNTYEDDDGISYNSIIDRNEVQL